MIRVYGQGRGEASGSQVTRGMLRAVEHCELLAGFVPCDMRDEHADYAGATADVSLTVGRYQSIVQSHRLGQHQRRWLLYAPNGEVLPDWFVAELTATSDILPRGLVDGLLAPSKWAAEVLSKHFPNIPVRVAPHGITPHLHVPDPKRAEEVRRQYDDGRFNVLHMTSTDTPRKGTKELLAAWKGAVGRHALPLKAQLTIIADPIHVNDVRWMLSEAGIPEEQARAWPGLTLTQPRVAEVYQMAHLVCQPSRAEGFGLCPLEALCCGTPVVATACTGHSEYLASCPPGALIVLHGNSEPMTDFHGSMAPSVSPVAIEAALVAAAESWKRMKRDAMDAADDLRSQWTWELQNERTLRALVDEEMA